MGVYVHMCVNFTGIKQEEWEKAYDESLKLLDAFPLPLMREKLEETEEYKRYILTRKIVENMGTPDENWEITGDMKSRQYAEDFRLYRNISKYKERRRYLTTHGDVLFADDEDLIFITNGVKVFGNKTQGYPYHFAVLAVGILFESKFPKNVCITGDISEWEVRKTVPWVNKILEKPVVVPICMDGPRLWKRLETLYPDKKKLLKRFKAIYRGSDELIVMLRCGGKSIVQEDFKDEIERYDSLSQLGAKRLIIDWLDTTKDIRALIELLCLPLGKRKFTLKDLLKSVCATFVNIPLEERRPLLSLNSSSERLSSIEAKMGALFATATGALKECVRNYYLSEEELLDVFYSFDETNRKTFDSLIKTVNSHLREYLKDLNEIPGPPKEAEKPEGKIESEDVSDELIPPEDIEVYEYEAEYEYEDVEKMLRETGETLTKIAEATRGLLEPYLKSDDREFILKSLINGSYTASVVLKEDAWEDIEKEEDISILKGLFLLMGFGNGELDILRRKIYILEHKSLWKTFIKYLHYALG